MLFVDSTILGWCFVGGFISKYFGFWSYITFSRFIYIRQASGLVREGSGLLHKLVLILIGSLVCSQGLMFPAKFMGDGSNFQSLLKGRFCSKTDITNTSLTEETDYIENPTKIKMLMAAVCLVFLFLAQYYYFSAVKHRYLV